MKLQLGKGVGVMLGDEMKHLYPIIRLAIGLLATAVCGAPTNAQIMYHGCGLAGSPAGPIVQQLNYMKNRSSSPKAKDIKPAITLEAVLAVGKDTNRWSNYSAAEIEGVVFDVKPGGIESTNCLAQDLAYRDTHIEIVRSMEDSGLTRRLIVEVTPRLRAMAAKRGLDWSTEALQALKGHKVRIIGWMLFDFEHIDESENTAPKRRDIWRATAWEIHPVTDIIVLESAVQYGLEEFRKSDSEKPK